MFCITLTVYTKQGSAPISQGSRAQPGTKNLHMYTTDPAPRHMNSVLEYSDLGEMLDMVCISLLRLSSVIQHA